MATIEEIWTYIDADAPFTLHLSDGRSFFVQDHHWISAHPSRKSTAVRVFDPAEDEEHFVPLYAVTGVSSNSRSG